MISEADIRATLRTRTFGRTVYAFDKIDSTNVYARSLRESDSAHGTLIVADEQTAGKGRQGRVWKSQKGMNLLFSLVLRPKIPHDRVRLLPFAAGLAVADAIEQTTGCNVECKWPNDLLVGGKKVAGMLIESTVQNEAITNVILGIGVNVNQTQFPAELNATSLHIHTGKDIDRVRLLCAVLEEVEQRYEQLEHFSPRMILDEWKQRAPMFGSMITLVEHGSPLKATAVDIAADGALVIEELNGARREVLAGDVTLTQH